MTKAPKARKKKPPKKGHHMATTPVLISIINQSSKVTDEEVAAATPAFGKQLADDFAPVWGAVPAVEFVPKGQKPSGNVMAYVVDDVPEAPGALGYHDVDRDGSVTGFAGMAYIKVAIVDGYVWTETMSHEILELVADFPANKWADGPDGSDYAHEMCDAVENDSYEIDGVRVSNFVYPAFFNPFATADDKLDHLGKLRKPFGMTSGGYQIKRTEPGSVSQVYARHVEGEDVRVVVDHHDSKSGRTIILAFSKDYPEEKKAAKVAKARRKFGKAA